MKNIDLPGGMDPASQEAIDFVSSQIVAHSPQPEVTVVESPPEQVTEDDRNPGSLEEIVLGLEIILAAVREMQDNG